MPYTYEQLGLGAHPYGLTPEERNERKVHLLEMQEQLLKAQEQLKEELEQATKESQTKTIEEQTKRLSHQKKMVAKRIEMIENVDLTEENIKKKTEPIVFTTDVTFSPELKAAIIEFGQKGNVNFAGAQKVAEKYGISQARAQKGREQNVKQLDLRDFTDMIAFAPTATDEEIEAYAMEYAEDYLNYNSGNPELKKARLDEFYDRVDAIDPLNLDLSCLTGNDKGERSGPGNLTPSERDFMKLIECFRMDQAYQSKEFENQEYFDARYANPKVKTRMRLTQELLFDKSFVGYLTSGLLANNGLVHDLTERPSLVHLSSSLCPQVGMQVYRQEMAVLMGEPCDMAIHVQIPENAAEELYDYGKPEAPGTEFAPDGFYFDYAFRSLFSTKVSEQYMEETGLDLGDMVYIDGVSVKEILEKEHPETREIRKPMAMKHMAMKALMSGEHRVEFARIQMNEKGTYTLNVSTVEPNLHALDGLERAREHALVQETPKKRGLFGFLRNKEAIPAVRETRADRADKLWATDPEREARQRKILESVNKKMMAAVNKKEHDKAVQKATEKMDFHALKAEFEEIDELNYKYDKKLIAERDALKKAVQDSKDTRTYNDRAFFGWMVEAKEGMSESEYRKKIDMALTSSLRAKIDDGVHMSIHMRGSNGKERVMQTDNTDYDPIKTMSRMGSRCSIVSLYAMTLDEPWKMTLDEVLSNDPALEAKKAEVGKKFVESMRIMGTAEFFKNDRKEDSYEAYFKKRNKEIYSIHVKMFEALENQPWDICKSTKISDLASNYKKINFLMLATQDWHQILQEETRMVERKPLEAMEDRNRIIGGALQNITKYATYVVSEDYLKPENTSSLINAYVARTGMDDVMKKCSGIQSLKEIPEKIDKEMIMEASLLLEKAAEQGMTPARLKDMGEYIKTGKNPLHKIDSKTKEVTWDFPSDKLDKKKIAGKVR